jgi:hypothetical protein
LLSLRGWERIEGLPLEGGEYVLELPPTEGERE